MTEATLKHQTVVVTGGSRGLGRAFAQALATAGARVAIIARNAEKLTETVRLIASANGQVLSVTADVTNDIAVRHAIDEIERSFGPVDWLVNNSSVMSPPGMDWEVDSYAWWRTVQINVRGPSSLSQTLSLPDKTKLLLRASLLCAVTLKIYADARHECFNASNRDEALAELLKWCKAVLA